MLQDPVDAGWQRLLKVDEHLEKHIESLLAHTSVLPQARFDPSTDEPMNEAGAMVSKLSMVAEELRVLRTHIRRMLDQRV